MRRIEKKTIGRTVGHFSTKCKRKFDFATLHVENICDIGKMGALEIR